MIIANKNQKLSFHLLKVAEVSKKIIKKLNLKDDDDIQKIEELAYFSGLLHDIGKVDPVFQRYIHDKTTTGYNPNGVHIEKVDKKAGFSFEEHPRHNEISWFILEELTNKKDFRLNAKHFEVLKSVVLWHHAAPIRNFEFNSSNIINALKKEKNEFLLNLKDLLSELKLDFYDDESDLDDMFEAKTKDLINYKAFYTSRNEQSLKDINLEEIKNDIKIESVASLLRAVVTTADRYVSASGENVNVEEIVSRIFEENKYSNLSKGIKKMEESFYPDSERSKEQLESAIELSKIKEVAILDAPAGSGKTKTSLQWARLKDAKKLYYIAPRTVICEEIYDELKNVYLPKNVSFEIITGDKKLQWDGKKEIEIDDDFPQFKSEIIITTIDQLIKSITTHKNVSVLFDMLNSCVIFDEFHEYYKLSGMDVLFAEYVKLKSKLEDSKLLIMSATPNYFMLKEFLEIYNEKSSLNNLVSFETTNNRDFSIEYLMYNEGDSLPADKSLFLREQENNDFNLTLDQSILENTEKSPFLKKWNNKKTIVISNTATMAQISYLINSSQEKAFLAHSKYKKDDKKNILSEIKSSFKKIEDKKYDILRAGPIVQASLNITSERLITDICTPENTLQRLGRLNRFGEDFTGEFIIAVPNRAILPESKEPSDVLRLLSKNNEKDSTIIWLCFLKKKFDISKKVTFKLKEIYDLYREFYKEDTTKRVMEEELLKSLKNSYRNIKFNVLDPVEIIGKKTKSKTKKLSKFSLRGQSYLVKMATYQLHNNQLKLTGNYADNITLGKDLILIYDENYIFVKNTIDKFEILNKDPDKKILSLIKRAKKQKSDKYNKIVLNLAKEENFNIITSFSETDLEILNKEKNIEESIVYLKSKNNAIGYINLKKLIK